MLSTYIIIKIRTAAGEAIMAAAADHIPLYSIIKRLKQQISVEVIPITVQSELIKTIETILQKSTMIMSQSRDAASIITGINKDKYEVEIDGTAFWVKNGIDISLHIGDSVWVHIPNGNKNEMFIMARK